MPDLYIGLMSGTSLDGVDAALCHIQSTSKLTVIDSSFTPYPKPIKQDLLALVFSKGEPNKKKLQTTHQQLGRFYADCANTLIKQSKTNKNDIAAIANHGQTIRHEPNASSPHSLQIGCPKEIAKLTGCNVIYDFRSADLKAGGQGAPLMPAFHNAIFKQYAPAAVINIGGIANITVIDKHKETIGFDTGPGNTLMDNWILKHKNEPYDADGDWAKSGKLIKSVLAKLLTDEYFSLTPPKSTGPDYFNLDWLQKQIPDLKKYKTKDIQATLLALTSYSITHEVSQHIEKGKVYLCGGGTQNKALVESIATLLPKHTIHSTDDLGISSDWLESIGFAWLGYCYLKNIPSNLTSVTGAKNNVVLGEMYKT